MKEKPIFAFVLIPFAPEFADIYKFGIKEPAKDLNIVAERVDEQIYKEGILERIYRQIEIADIIIADMTGQNPNVFYEIGYAHAKGKLCIHLTSDANDIPFDLKDKRHIIYGNSIEELRVALTRELNWAKNEIENIRKSLIKVHLKNIYGELDKTEYIAKGSIYFKIDLLNEFEKTSSEIEAIYFYTSTDWDIYQDDKLCPSAKSDLPDFHKRHFLNSPIRKMASNSWAQVSFKAIKILARAYQGEALKDSYRIIGKSILRLMTSESNFDYDIRIDTTVDDLPF